MSESPVRVGVLSLHNSKETKAILNAVEALGHDPEWIRAENTVVRFGEEVTRLTPVVDVIANRLLLSNTDQPSEELGLAQTLEGVRPMLNSHRRRPPRDEEGLCRSIIRVCSRLICRI